MRTNLLLLALASLLTACQQQASSPQPQQADIDQARQLVKRFAGQLKPKLKAAMQSGGPAHAIEVCAEQAPSIANQLSEESGWQIKRVSLKPRNIVTAKPDEFEQRVLTDFESQRLAGKPVAEMAFAGIDNGRFRFLKPQPVEAVCLACHGENIAPDVKAALTRFAPGDTATGYQLGEIRGAFSLSKAVSD